MSGPFGMERGFTMSQEGENLDYNKRAMNPCSLHWWDPDDEKTWVPYGWHVKNPQGWIDYTTEATKTENGLEPSIPWDPNNPESWVPHGWKVKDPSKWKDFSAQRSTSSAEEFFLVESPASPSDRTPRSTTRTPNSTI